ncbi:MAG: hypothetical protein U0326_44180 [Polyangiales bacterium]
MSPTALFTVMISGLLAIAAWSRLSEAYRVSALARAASALGMRFESRAGRFITNGPGALSLFRVGGGLGRNLVTDGRLTLFEYLSRATADGRQPVEAQVVVAVTEARGVPPFRLEFKRPGAFGLTSGVYAASDEITFEGHHGFAESYRLFGEDHAAVAALFDASALAFFAANPGWSVETNGAWLAVWEGAGHLDPSSLAAQVERHRAVASRFV